MWLLAARQEDLCYTTQTLVEFWNVCTRPATARGGLGLSLQATERKVRFIENRFRFLPESFATHQEWQRLVAAHAVVGVQVHDTMLVAVMNVHSVPNLLTFNKGDFKRFPGITALDPFRGDPIFATRPASTTANSNSRADRRQRDLIQLQAFFCVMLG